MNELHYYNPAELEKRLAQTKEGTPILVVDEVANKTAICFDAHLGAFAGTLKGKDLAIRVRAQLEIRADKSPQRLNGLSFPKVDASSKLDPAKTTTFLLPTPITHSVYIGEKEIRDAFHNDVDDRAMPYAAQALNILLSEYAEKYRVG